MLMGEGGSPPTRREQRARWALRDGRGGPGADGAAPGRRGSRRPARRVCETSPGAMRGVRGRERHGPTRTHPEPGRDPWQRRRVLRGRLRGRRGRRGHPPGWPDPVAHTRRRGVEQWQLVGLITQRSQVRVLPPLPSLKIQDLRTSPEVFLALLWYAQKLV